MTEEQSNINGDLCAMRCAVRGLTLDRNSLTDDDKAEIVEIYNALGVLVIENIESTEKEYS